MALGVVVVLGAAHLAAPLLGFLRMVPRSRVLSAAGGISVAYVFVHLLPEIAEAQRHVEESAPGLLPDVERHTYVVALLGLAVFYGLESLARRSRLEAEEADGDGTSPGAFAISVVSFALYNGVIGYLVTGRAEEQPVLEVALFGVAIAVHFVANDLGLRHHHRRRYDRIGRPVLVAAVLAGWAVGALAEIHEAAVGVAVAFLGGGIVLNVMKEELPEERASRFSAFAAGAAGYALVLLAV